MTTARKNPDLAIFIGIFFLIAGLVLVAGCIQKNPEPGPVSPEAGVVTTDAGSLQGTTENGVTVYRGIPYAAAPVGDLRWKPPAAVQSWPGVRNATAYGAVCPQPKSGEFDVMPVMSEDCLFLNVWTPAKNLNEKLPVMVFIHGGAWKTGAGSQALFEGSPLADKGVVVVTLNYRLGALGWMAHPELTAESPHNSSGNYGILDQQAALKWVEKNIGAFGGDPSRVTVFGESAGGNSIYAHLVSPGSKGLFRQAIIESGPFFSDDAMGTVFRPRSEAEQYGVEFARGLNISGPGTIQQMRAKSALEILNATPELKSPFWTMRTIQFKPITDGWIIPAAPQEVFRQGTQNPVPLIVGNNAAEGIPLALDTNMTVPEYQQYIRERFGKNADQILAAYPAGTPAEVQAQTERVMTVYDFDHASKLVAGSMAGLNQSTYLYRFTYALPGQPYGAYHGSELYFIFRHFPGEPDPASNKVSDTMMDYWTQFAKTGSPNGMTNVNWPEYDTRTRQYLDINTTSSVATAY